MNLFDKVDARHGAPMGRAPWTENPLGESLNLAVSLSPTYRPEDSELKAQRASLAALRAEPLRFYLQRARLDSGGYDRGGAYWGHGQPVYVARSTCDRVQRSYRAPNRYGALLQIREEFPAARIFGAPRMTWAELTMHRLETSTVTESELRKARAVLAAALSGRSQRVACSEAEALQVLAHVDDMRDADASPVIRGEWCDKAAAYLQRLTFRKDGEMRANAWTRQLSRGDADTLRAVDHFTLYSLDAIDRGRGFYYVEPVFTVYGSNGNGIIYSSTPWQSGGDGPRVVGHVYALEGAR